MILKKVPFLIIIFSLITPYLYSENYNDKDEKLESYQTNTPYSIDPYSAPSNNNIDEILSSWLGMYLQKDLSQTLKQVKNIDKNIVFKEEKDAEWNFEKEPSFLESYPRPYLDKIYIQFYKKKSSLVRLFFRKKKVSYLTILQSLKKKISTEPVEYTFDKVVWKEKNKVIQLKRNQELMIYDERFFKLLKQKARITPLQ